MEEALAECVDSKGGADPRKIVKLTGMPFTALHDDIAVFFAGCDIEGGKKRYVPSLPLS